MSDYNNIPLGLQVPSQIPLDVKTYVQNEDSLKNLGASNQLAFSYIKGYVFYCIEEGTRYEWREVKAGEEDSGLLTTDYVYPAYAPVFNIDYSNKRYNFFSFAHDIHFANGQNTIVSGTGKDFDPFKIDAIQLKLLAGNGITFQGNGTQADPLKIKCIF